MQRRVNCRFAAFLLVAVVFTGAATILVHSMQTRSLADAYQQQSELAEQEGDLLRAAHWLEKYVAARPDDTDALIRFAKLLEKTADGPAARNRALQVMAQAIRRRPDDEGLRREAIRLAMRIGRYDEAERQLRHLLTKRPNEAPLWADLGLALEGKGDYAQAERAYRHSIKIRRGYLTGYSRLAGLLHFRLERTKDALTVARQMIKASPSDFRAWLASARFKAQLGLNREALDEIEKAAKLAEDNLTVIIEHARLLYLNGRDDKAEQMLRRGLAGHAKSAKLYLSLAWLQARRGEYQRAIAWLRKGIAAGADRGRLQPALADLLVSHGNRKDAERAISELESKPETTEVADCLRARLLLMEGKPIEAQAVLRNLEPWIHRAGEPWIAHYWFLQGLAASALGDMASAEESLERAITLAPRWTAARVALADTFLQLGLPSQALRQIEATAGAEDRTPDAVLLHARALLRVIEDDPEYRADWPKLEALLDRAARHCDPAEVAILEAEMFMAKKMPGKAKRVLQDALKQASEKKQAKLVAGLALCNWYSGDRDGARRLLVEAEKQQGLKMPLVLAWLDIARRSEGSEGIRIVKRLEDAIQRDSSHPEAITMRRQIADAYYALHDRAAARRLWERLAAQFPYDLLSRTRLFDLALDGRFLSEARRWMKELKRIEGESGVLWRYAELAISAAFSPPVTPSERKEWSRRLAELEKRRPDWGKLPLLRGWLAERLGDYRQAREQYLRAAMLGEASPAMLDRLVRLLLANREFIKAQQIVARANRRGVYSKVLQTAAVEIDLYFGRNRDAVAKAYRIVNPRSYRDRLWLVNVLERAGEEDSVKKELDRLTHDFPQVPQVWIAAIRRDVERGDADSAAATLAAALEQLPEDRKSIVQARGLELLGRTEQARELLEKLAVDSSGDFTALRRLAAFYLRHRQYRSAEPLLRKLMARRDLPDDLADETRRDLALALAAQDDEAKFQEALNLVTWPKGRPQPWIEKIVRARVLAHRESASRQAIEVYEDAAAQKPLPHEDALRLAELYSQHGSPDKASAVLLQLIREKGEKPDYIARLIRNLITAGDRTTAEFWLRRLAEISPNHRDLRELRRMLFPKKQRSGADRSA